MLLATEKEAEQREELPHKLSHVLSCRQYEALQKTQKELMLLGLVNQSATKHQHSSWMSGKNIHQAMKTINRKRPLHQVNWLVINLFWFLRAYKWATKAQYLCPGWEGIALHLDNIWTVDPWEKLLSWQMMLLHPLFSDTLPNDWLLGQDTELWDLGFCPDLDQSPLHSENTLRRCISTLKLLVFA